MHTHPCNSSFDHGDTAAEFFLLEHLDEDSLNSWHQNPSMRTRWIPDTGTPHWGFTDTGTPEYEDSLTLEPLNEDSVTSEPLSEDSVLLKPLSEQTCVPVQYS